MKQQTTRNTVRRIAALLLASVLLLGLFAGCKENEPAPSKNAVTEDVGKLTDNAVYTLEELEANDPRLDAVIATCGDRNLTNRDYQLYFYMQYFSFMGQYGAYASYFGLDPDKPLSEQQSMMEEGHTWEQVFVKASLQQFHQFAVLYDRAAAAGHTLSQEEQDNLDEVFSGLPDEAKKYKFETVDDYVAASFGPGVTQQDYENFMRMYFLASSYENKLYSELTWTDEEMLAYAKEHPDDFGEVSDEHHNIMVRHILIKTEDTAAGGETETGETAEKLTEEEAKAAAKAKAEEVLAEYEKDPTEENFAALAEKYSADTGSVSSGGLYDDVYPGQMVQQFNDWCFDSARKPGDTDIVETTYGYHVMYFVGETDHYQWQTEEWKTNADQTYHEILMNKLLESYMDEQPCYVDYSAIIVSPMPADEAAADEIETVEEAME